MEESEEFLWVRAGSSMSHFHPHSVGQNLISRQYITAKEAGKYQLCARKKWKWVLVKSWLIPVTQILTSNQR